MTKFIIRRILFSIPVLIAISLATFLLIHALPGGPFDAVGFRAMPENIKAVLEHRYGLDRPLYEQYFLYMRNLLSGDLGPMLKFRGQSVNEIVAQSWPVSIQVGLLSLFLGWIIGIPSGIIAALNHNKGLDHTATFIAVLGVSIPNMVLAPFLILVFGVYLDWLPIAFWGADPPFILGFLPNPTAEFWLHAVLPVVALGTALSAGVMRLTRAGLLEVLTADYIRTARAKGLRERAVIIIHALKNSLIPVATMIGPQLAAVLTGTFIIEQIFALNGLGRHYVNSINQREYFLLTSVTLIYGLFLILGNILVDIIYAWLDPRIRFD